MWGERAHVPAVQALPELELAAVCTAHADTAQAFAQRTGAPTAYSDVDQLVQDPDLDLITVATRVSLHHAMATATLKAGKHVYCEWPLASDVAQAQELVDLARQHHRVAAVVLQGRWSPLNRFVHRLMQEGYIGDLLSFSLTQFSPQYLQPMSSQRWWLAVEEEGGSALTITGGHSIDALCWFVGDPSELSASVETQVSLSQKSELVMGMSLGVPSKRHQLGRW